MTEEEIYEFAVRYMKSDRWADISLSDVVSAVTAFPWIAELIRDTGYRIHLRHRFTPKRGLKYSSDGIYIWNEGFC